jgi:threonine dehydrogenase-like Zn-dependent dehydrogenase
MHALRYDDQLQLHDDEPVPLPNSHEALIRVRMAGICHTDVELTRGYYNFHGVLGHEFVGDIVEGTADWLPGTRVVGEINIGCGQCDMCMAGIRNHCRQRHTLGIANYSGTFAEYIKLPYINLFKVPENVPDTWAIFTEPLAAALQVKELSPILPAQRVLVIGAGKVGLLIAQVLKLTGCDLTVLVRRDKPKQLLEKWKIAAIDSREQQITTLRGSMDVIVEVTGSEEGFALAVDLVRPRGTIALKSTYAETPKADLSRLVVNEIKVVGSRCGPFEEALRLLEQRLVDVESMIESCYPLKQAVEAFDHAARSGVLKVLLQP